MKIKVLFLILSLSSLKAQTTPNELGINMGITSINNDSGTRFNNYGMGISYQLDKYVVMPRFDLDYVKVSDFSDDRVDNLFKASINGVYEIENRTLWTPYIMGGVGYEKVSREVDGVFESHPFVQGALGVNYNFKEGYKAKVESKLLQILGGDNEDNEVILNFGMSFPIIKKAKKKRKKAKKIVIKKVATPHIIRVVRPPTKIIKTPPDSDRDGVIDKLDQCPNTPYGYSVDSYGCPIKITLQIHFGVNSSRITEYSMPKVERFAQFLLKNKGSKVTIIGHTDSDGSSDKNLILSQKRARAVANKLLELGVSASRITAIGKGESMPIASNRTKEGKRKNRRIEAILSYPKR
ncbi:MAG: OmpA family protein [Epsilonproteobacteria bacterium]|nr:OmpA family protein [Campylobacterota bacterium]